MNKNEEIPKEKDTQWTSIECTNFSKAKSGNEELHTGQTIRTFTGKYVDVLNPDPDTIDIVDIAHALSHMCRFAGHTPVFYSVAQHSTECVELYDGELTNTEKLTILLHDASEAYLLDMPRPIKRHLKDYKALEEKMMKVIATKFNLEYPFPSYVKAIDNLMLEYEHNNLILGKGPFDTLIPSDAKSHFLTLYNRLEVFRKFSQGDLKSIH